MQFWPHTPNSHGYTSTSAIESMWKDRFQYLYSEVEEDENGDVIEGGKGKDFVFPLVLHPDTSGMAHVIGMIDRFIGWLKDKGEEVEFVRFADCAEEWKSRQRQV